MKKIFSIAAALLLSTTLVAQNTTQRGHVATDNTTQRGHVTTDGSRFGTVQQERGHINNNNPQAHRIANEDQITTIAKYIKGISFDSDRVKAMKCIVQVTPIPVDGLKQIMKSFSFDDARLEVLKFAYPYCPDTQNYQWLNNAFSFSYNYDKLAQYIKQEGIRPQGGYLPEWSNLKLDVDPADAVINTILTRRSIRKYKKTKVSHKDMEEILNCGINAPSAMNQQPWEVRVVDSKDFIEGVTERWLNSLSPEEREKTTSEKGFRNMFRNAPTVVFIATPEGRGQLDAGLLSENMMLSAWSMGIGSCCLGGPIRFMNTDAQDYVQRLGFSQGYQLTLAIAFGYPDEKPAAKPRDTSKVKFVE